jgi:hypothetical protein
MSLEYSHVLHPEKQLSLYDAVFPIRECDIDFILDFCDSFQSEDIRRSKIEDAYIRQDKEMSIMVDDLIICWDIDPSMSSYYLDGYAMTQMLIHARADAMHVRLPFATTYQVDTYFAELDLHTMTREEWTSLLINEYRATDEGEPALIDYIEECIKLNKYDTDLDERATFMDGCMDSYDFSRHCHKDISYTEAIFQQRSS